ncbi:cytochrome c oxidase, cbb3-type subunit I [Lysobacter helvus]|uniref:cytochrome-c oxidase n=2 Tax=Lysobacteraceae TaxID=32033 RepID=A0ABM7Q8G4_9GAMM|nr:MULTISPECIES: cytochrome-c oxidase, cbb3-type subunit I [Lysobacter]BCT93732.1 cytochrome c oxidase, cbb3-type subunit I [Lysobacter caseinilyticus]BCT96888.1 cytochrome c oxidase, cbb3-type subunit I [Lysobacter helvus]
MPNAETYDDQVIRLFLLAAALWGVVGMSLGVYVASELVWPALNFDTPWLSFGRLRPDHTFAIIFAFGGSALMGTCFYVVQRTGHVRLALGRLATFVFWGWQTAMVLALVTIPLGYTQSKEYAEPEWTIDLLIAVVWVSFAVVFFATLAKRRIRHIYVANWYYGAFIIAVALLHIVNNLVIPVSIGKSYPIYSGGVDAMVQWWYGHNAVAFFLTAGFLAMMYYFVPRQAQQPLWSYRFSIINFWALISVYMWAGSHHLLYTSLPDWVQSVGMAFSLLLLMPSLGSAANGLMTFNGSWHQVRVDPAAKFMVLALVCYAGTTFEGSMMAIKSVNSLTHDTDWTVAHVHFGAIGWVAMIAIGSLYAMAPKALGRPQMHSVRAMNVHFWLHTVGLLIYIVSMWSSGLTAGLMWRETNADGQLVHSFLDSLVAIRPFYIARLFGGVLVLSGMVIMVWNLWCTAAQARKRTIKAVLVPIPQDIHEPTPLQVPPPLPAKG